MAKLKKILNALHKLSKAEMQEALNGHLCRPHLKGGHKMNEACKKAIDFRTKRIDLTNEFQNAIK